MSQGRRKAEKPITALSLAGTAISYLALCVTVLAALALVIIPLLTGSQTYSVLTSSMAPKYAPGTFLVVKPVPFEELRVGDIITYQIESGKDAVITHRITGIGASQDGEVLFTTKGDNNSVEDELPVREVQVRGKLFYAVPYVGFVANSLGNSDRGEIAQWGAVALMGYGVVTLVRGALAKKRRSSSDSETGGQTPDAGVQAPFSGPAAPAGRGTQDPVEHDDPVLTECDCEGHEHLPRTRRHNRAHATV
ncbi:MAG: signal peptidase I [Arthrobacter sp.]